MNQRVLAHIGILEAPNSSDNNNNDGEISLTANNVINSDSSSLRFRKKIYKTNLTQMYFAAALVDYLLTSTQYVKEWSVI